jgi:hypothetical protein
VLLGLEPLNGHLVTFFFDIPVTSVGITTSMLALIGRETIKDEIEVLA